MTIYQKAVNKFGEQAQMRKACEELGELITEIMRYQNGYDRASLLTIASEVADVEIMCAQMRVMVGDNRVDNEKTVKLAKLQKLIAKK